MLPGLMHCLLIFVMNCLQFSNTEKYDGHDSHLDDRALTQMQSKNIQPFILKAGDPINDHPNDNGPN